MSTNKELFTEGEWSVSHEAAPDLTVWAKYKISEGTTQNECVATIWATSNTEANAALIAESKVMYLMIKEEVQYLEEWIERLGSSAVEGMMRVHMRERKEFFEAIINRINQK